MSMGRMSSTMPVRPRMYLYCARSSRFLTTASVTTIAATETKSHSTWPMAKSGLSLVTKAMPMPESTKTSGRITGSAPGAR